jgi:diadenosine tetraphosphatase ApaH/serine/threonine PP2A family protein phosphatase
MRFAIISDIHSNLEALNKALAIIDSRSIDSIVCLGDIVGYGANPNECVEIVAKRCSTILLGNHDAAALDQSVAKSFTTYARLSAEWTSENLLPAHKDFLKSLPLTELKEGAFLVHASPFEPSEWYYIISLADARNAFGYFAEQICFVGHSHLPGVFGEMSMRQQVQRGERFIANVGSVGQPRDGNPNLSFGIFDTERWTYENVRASYDIKTASEKIVSAGLPQALADRLWSGV